MLRIPATVVVGEAKLRGELHRILALRGYELLDSEGPDQLGLAVIECGAQADDAGLQCAQRIRARNQTAQLVILAKTSSEELALAALRLRAAEYLRAPFNLEQLSNLLDSLAGPDTAACAGIIGESQPMKKVRSFVADVAPVESTVLITGPTGSGKELVAEEIHRLSPRRDKRFVCLNCAAIPDTLLESELFGYERGAFTGASASRSGKLAQANGGTVFFDEIGDMSLFSQAKILRAIEAKELYRLGSSHRQVLDIRVIAATNRDLEALVRDDRFRSDLYYRLNVARVRLPALNERPSDIALLVEHFLPRFNQTFGRRVIRFERDALQVLAEYSWPGNVRELRNVIEVTYLRLKGDIVTARDLPDEIRGETTGERERLMAALLETQWNVSQAARKLHWSRMTMYRRLAKHNLRAEGPSSKNKTAASGD